MSVQRNNSDNIPDELKRVITALKFAGIGAIIAGIACLIFKEAVMNFLGMDDYTTTLIAGMLVFIGVLDIFVVPRILINGHKQTQNNDS